jgi:23S rRNA (cytidine1920-2'-O)/16S rRNA (cytidine1409-2'-O)-methyltransferase
VPSLKDASAVEAMECMTGSGKTRVDLLLVERGLVPSRERARALILAGRVLVREQKVDKPGTAVPADSPIRLLGEDQPYVSRGGLKLAEALSHWQIPVTDSACLDVGASTGGFTDCLLQHGAAHVTAVDTGFGQIAMKLRNDPRVRLLERTNARFLEPGSLVMQVADQENQLKRTGFSPYIGTDQENRLKGTGSSPHTGAANRTGALAPEATPQLTLLVMDVSFISATLLLGPVLAAAHGLREAVILVKPQFEAGREHVGKGGIVRDPQAHQLAVDKVADCVRSLGWQVVETMPSPITGAEGNREFLLYARRPQTAVSATPREGEVAEEPRRMS